MTRNPVVLIDCDGVLADFNKAALDFIHRHTGQLFTADQITQWDVLKNFDLQHLEPKLDEEIEHTNYCLDIEPFAGTHGALFDLHVYGADVHCVTAPYHIWTWPGRRTMWLQREYGFDKHHVHHIHSKHMVKGDVFIDDSLRNCLKYAEHHENAQVFLWERSYNQISADKLPTNVCRTNDWNTVIEYVKNFGVHS